jgi:uncharacterized membrane protein YozB (DUF420 family)
MNRSRSIYQRPHWPLILLLPVTLIAFWPGYLTQLDDSPWQVHFHGITGFAWFLLLIGQSVLASQRRFDLHRRLGKVTYVLAPLVLLGGFMVLYTMAARLNGDSTNPFFQTFGYRLGFIDRVGNLHFAVVVALALIQKRDIALHSRLMLSSVIPLLYAVFSRFYDFESFWTISDVSFLTAELIVIALIVHDHRRGGIRYPWVLALGVLLFQHFMFRPIGDMVVWQTIFDGYWRLLTP